MIVVAIAPVTASAVECVKRTTTYWGYLAGGGAVEIPQDTAMCPVAETTV